METDIRKGTVPGWGKLDFTLRAESDLLILTKRVFMNRLSISVSTSAKPVCTSCYLWKGSFQVNYMWPFFLHVGTMCHRVLTTFRDRKDIFWMENVTHTIKSISGRGLPGSLGKAGMFWGRECQTLCKLETWWLECNFEMVSLAVTFVFRCHWLRFCSIAQPFLPFLLLISLFTIIHSLSPFLPHLP